VPSNPRDLAAIIPVISPSTPTMPGWLAAAMPPPKQIAVVPANNMAVKASQDIDEIVSQIDALQSTRFDRGSSPTIVGSSPREDSKEADLNRLPSPYRAFLAPAHAYRIASHRVHPPGSPVSHTQRFRQQAPTPPSPSPPPRLARQAKRNVYDLVADDDTDADWSTLPKRKRTNAKSRKSMAPKLSGAFRLPLASILTSRMEPTIEKSSVSTKRVITYVPPPREPKLKELRDEEKQAEQTRSDAGLKEKDPLQWTVKRPRAR
jgi:hypothetical protein